MRERETVPATEIVDTANGRSGSEDRLGLAVLGAREPTAPPVPDDGERPMQGGEPTDARVERLMRALAAVSVDHPDAYTALDDVIADAAAVGAQEVVACAVHHRAVAAYQQADLVRALTGAWHAARMAASLGASALRDRALMDVGQWLLEAGHASAAAAAYRTVGRRSGSPEARAHALLGLLEAAAVTGNETQIDRYRALIQVETLAPAMHVAYHHQSGEAWCAAGHEREGREALVTAAALAATHGLSAAHAHAMVVVDALDHGATFTVRTTSARSPTIRGVAAAVVAAAGSERALVPHRAMYRAACAILMHVRAGRHRVRVRAAVAEFARARTSADHAATWRAVKAFGRRVARAGAREAARRWFLATARVARANGDTPLAALALHEYAALARRAADFRAAIRADQIVVDMARVLGDVELGVLAGLGVVLARAGRDERAPARAVTRAGRIVRAALGSDAHGRPRALVRAARTVARVLADETLSPPDRDTTLLMAARVCRELGLQEAAASAWEAVYTAATAPRLRASAALGCLVSAIDARDEERFARWRQRLEHDPLSVGQRRVVLRVLGAGLRIFGQPEAARRLDAVAERYAALAGRCATGDPLWMCAPTPPPTIVDGASAMRSAMRRLVARVRMRVTALATASAHPATVETLLLGTWCDRQCGRTVDWSVVEAAITAMDAHGRVGLARAALEQLARVLRAGVEGQAPIAAVREALVAYGERYLTDDAVRDGITWFEAVVAAAERIGDRWCLARALIEAARAHLLISEFDATQRALDAARVHAIAVGDAMLRIETDFQAAQLAARRGNLGEASALIDAVITEANAIGSSAQLLPALYDRAHLRYQAAMTGYPAGPARDAALMSALESFGEMFNLWTVEHLAGRQAVMRWTPAYLASRQAIVLIATGVCLAELGEVAAADAAFRVAFDVAPRPHVRQLAAVNLLDVASRRGHRAMFQAWRTYLVHEPVVGLLEATLFREWGEGLERLGDARGAVRALEAAAAAAEWFGLRAVGERVRQSLDRVRGGPRVGALPAASQPPRPMASARLVREVVAHVEAMRRTIARTTAAHAVGL